MRLNHSVKFLSIFLVILSLSLNACGEDPPSGPAVILPTPTDSPKPTPTPLVAIQTNEWAVVKFAGAEVRDSPLENANTLEKLGGYTVVALELKLVDESWVQRAKGGWIKTKDLVIYNNEFLARRSVPTAASGTPVVPPAGPTVKS